MYKKLLLLAGYPGTGKTFLCNVILAWRNRFVALSPDAFKEKNWEASGFDSEEEKEKLIQRGWQEYFEDLESLMRQGAGVISDYPFSDKQRPRLARLARLYGYQTVTIRLTGDLDALFERQKKRDMDPGRHLGHVRNCYHPGDQMTDRRAAEALLDYDEFIDRCKTRGYGSFALGHLIEVDTTDFKAVDTAALLRQLEAILDGEAAAPRKE